MPSTKSKKPRTVADLYNSGVNGTLMDGIYTHRTDIHELIQRRHRAALKMIHEDGVYRKDGHEWPVPYGIRAALRVRLTWAQIANQYPFYTTWTSPKTGKKLRKKHMSLVHAIHFIATKAQYVDPEAFIEVRHHLYIPTKLMGKFPRKWGPEQKWHYWCPRCCQPRRFRRTTEEFLAQKKFWSEEKQRYIWKEVKLALMVCEACGCNNRDNKFRASNQPLEKRKFKKGARKATRRNTRKTRRKR